MSNDVRTPSHNLWGAVLAMAYGDLSDPNAMVRQSARWWFLISDRTGVGSLPWICVDVLSMSSCAVDRIRRRIGVYGPAEDRRMTIEVARREAAIKQRKDQREAAEAARRAKEIIP